MRVPAFEELCEDKMMKANGKITPTVSIVTSTVVKVTTFALTSE